MSADRERLEALRIDRSQDRKRKPVRWLLFLAIAVVVVVAAAWWFSREGAAQIRTATVTEEKAPTLSRTVLNASGYVTARRQATVSSKVTGKVAEVLIEEGVKVRDGEILARLDQSNVSARLRLAEAQLAASGSALRETEVRLAEARLELKRTKSLVAGEVASQAELDAAEAAADSLQARLELQREDVKVASRQVTLWRQELEDTVIRAPFSGVVVSKNAQPGEMISPISAGGGFTRTGICTLVDMNSLEIEVDVNESYINRVQQGQPVEATLDAYPAWKIPASVIAIVPTADRQKATVKVRIGFDSLDPRILPDMGIKVAFQVKEGQESAARETVLLIPPEALRRDGGQDVVFVVSDGCVERRAVRVQQRADGRVWVISGLTGGERVVVSGPADLEDGDRIKEVMG